MQVTETTSNRKPLQRLNTGAIRTEFTLLKKLIWLYFLFLLFEGALRKWFLPGLSQGLLIIRDPIVVWIYYIAYNQGLLSLQNKYIQALRQVKLILKKSNDPELYFDIFFNICLSLNLEQELINAYPLINDSNNEALIVKFFTNYSSLQNYDKEIFKDLIIKERIRYPENDDLNQLYNKVK